MTASTQRRGDKVANGDHLLGLYSTYMTCGCSELCDMLAAMYAPEQRRMVHAPAYIAKLDIGLRVY